MLLLSVQHIFPRKILRLGLYRQKRMILSAIFLAQIAPYIYTSILCHRAPHIMQHLHRLLVVHCYGMLPAPDLTASSNSGVPGSTILYVT